ncbi:MAG: Holliday junction resolvase RuvX [Elusimicrobiota bacterium]|nr:Holliday junction resolvase RuvX [Elusimicrobiota bacterium]
MRILSIDYGKKRLGIAISDELGITAQPLTTISRDNTELKAIVEIIKEYDVREIVFGLPINMNGTKSKSTIEVEQFANELTSFFKSRSRRIRSDEHAEGVRKRAREWGTHAKSVGRSGRGKRKVSKGKAEQNEQNDLADIKIQFIDERLSTAEANKMLIGFDVSRKKRKSSIDKLSAAIILENYLETKVKSKNKK